LAAPRQRALDRVVTAYSALGNHGSCGSPEASSCDPSGQWVAIPLVAGVVWITPASTTCSSASCGESGRSSAADARR
jgi:hypothetical protein